VPVLHPSRIPTALRLKRQAFRKLYKTSAYNCKLVEVRGVEPPSPPNAALTNLNAPSHLASHNIRLPKDLRKLALIWGRLPKVLRNAIIAIAKQGLNKQSGKGT
jgi:hypothetical protein